MLSSCKIATKWYPFGMLAQNYNAKSYRLGFNGFLKDNEIYGSGNSYDMGAKMYRPDLARFFSPDPLIVYEKKYPELSSYQFASNRPIDGLDLDGFEYATFNIFVKNGKVIAITVVKDYELKDPNTKGPGKQYNWIFLDKNNKVEKTYCVFKKNKPLIDYGIYQGSNNPRLPKIGEKPFVLYDDYRLEPIDEQDANAKRHDENYDLINASGPKDAFSNPNTIEADKQLIKDSKGLIERAKRGGIDKITNKPISKESVDAAENAISFFQIVRPIKNYKNLKQEDWDRGVSGYGGSHYEP